MKNSKPRLTEAQLEKNRQYQRDWRARQKKKTNPLPVEVRSDGICYLEISLAQLVDLIPKTSALHPVAAQPGTRCFRLINLNLKG